MRPQLTWSYRRPRLFSFFFFLFFLFSDNDERARTGFEKESAERFLSEPIPPDVRAARIAIDHGERWRGAGQKRRTGCNGRNGRPRRNLRAKTFRGDCTTQTLSPARKKDEVRDEKTGRDGVGGGPRRGADETSGEGKRANEREREKIEAQRLWLVHASKKHT